MYSETRNLTPILSNEHLQTLLSLPPSPLVTSSIKAHLAPLLLRAHGELIVSLGQRRNSSKRFHAEGALSIEEIGVVGEVLAPEGGGEGEKGGEEILEIVQARLKEAVAEMGGEVSRVTYNTFFYPLVRDLTETSPFRLPLRRSLSSSPRRCRPLIRRSSFDSFLPLSSK